MERIKVADVMTKNPITVKPDTNLFDCAKKMVRKKIGSLIIVDKNKEFKGILSEKDILWALIKRSKKGLAEVKAIDISPRKIVKIKPNLTIREVVEKIKKSKLERFPVVEKNILLGIVTVRDILNFNPEIYPELEEFSKIREETKKLKRIEKAKETGFSVIGKCSICGKEDELSKQGRDLVCEKCKNSI